MRLPWPFGRAQRSAKADGAAAPGGAPAPVPERGSGAAWRELPPLAETVGPPPLVAPSRPFAASLASSEAPAPILAPLSHGRSLEAPKGLVSGIARPSAAISGPPVPTPVQRSPTGGRRAIEDDGADWQGSGARDAVVSSPVAAGTAAGTSPAAEAASLPASPVTSVAPIRRLEPVAVASPAKALTRAPEPNRTAPLVGLIGQARAGGPAGAPIATPPPMPVPAIQRSPAPSAAATAAEPGAAPASASPAQRPTPAAPTQGSPATPRLTIGQARRLGLGAPIAGGPVSGSMAAFANAPARTQGAPAPESGSSGATAAPVLAHRVQRSPASDAEEPMDMPFATGGATAAAEGPDEVVAPALAAPGIQRAPAFEPVVARPLPVATDRPPLGAGSPILAAQPLRTGVQRAPLTLPQRAPGDGTSASTATGAAETRAGEQVTVHRDGQASQLSAALDARSFTHGGEIFLPASHGSLTSGTGKALLAHELTHVVQQRRLGSSLPAEHSPHGQSLEAEAVAAERAGNLPLAMPGPGGPRSQGPDQGAGQAGAQRAPDDAPPAPPSSHQTITVDLGTAVQRAPSDGAMTVGGDASGRDGHKHTEGELEDLAGQLYARIGRRLRRELLVDRERVGLALDVR